MQDPIKPSKDVIMLGQLPADDFEASVSKAREAARARIGLSTEPRQQFESVAARPQPVITTATAPMAVPIPAPMPAPIATPAAPPQPPANPAGHTVAHAHVAPMPRPAPAPIAAAPAAVPHLVAAPPPAAARAAAMPVEPPAAPPPPVFATPTMPPPPAAPATAPAAAKARRGGVRVSLPVVGVGLLALAGVAGGLLYFEVGGLSLSGPTAAAATTGTMHITSRPAGATVIVDGTPRGTAPLEIKLPPGQHTLEVQSGATRRSLPLVIDAGTIVRQYVDFAAPADAAGKLEITSDPPGAQVLVDGTPRGITPLIVTEVAPGSHTIAIGSGESTVMRTVDVAAGATAAVVVSLAPTEGAAGWVTLKAPFPMEMRQGDRMLAAAGVDRVMLPTGRHQLDLVAREFEFTTTVTVTVQAGKTAAAAVVVPEGRLSINAAPWAEVWLDGKPMGTTPLGNLSVPIGPHEIVWKHPQLGERRQTVRVLAQTPVRASMDFGK
jgi:hypothetical protein